MPWRRVKQDEPVPAPRSSRIRSRLRKAGVLPPAPPEAADRPPARKRPAPDTNATGGASGSGGGSGGGREAKRRASQPKNAATVAEADEVATMATAPAQASAEETVDVDAEETARDPRSAAAERYEAAPRAPQAPENDPEAVDVDADETGLDLHEAVVRTRAPHAPGDESGVKEHAHARDFQECETDTNEEVAVVEENRGAQGTNRDDVCEAVGESAVEGEVGLKKRLGRTEQGEIECENGHEKQLDGSNPTTNVCGRTEAHASGNGASNIAAGEGEGEGEGEGAVEVGVAVAVAAPAPEGDDGEAGAAERDTAASLEVRLLGDLDALHTAAVHAARVTKRRLAGAVLAAAALEQRRGELEAAAREVARDAAAQRVAAAKLDTELAKHNAAVRRARAALTALQGSGGDGNRVGGAEDR